MISYPLRLARKAAWMLGLTEERQLDFSSPITAAGKVVSKSLEPQASGCSMPAFCIAGANAQVPGGYSYRVDVEAAEARFEEDDIGLFLSVEEGDPVSVRYVQVIETRKDYSSQNFETKSVMSSRIIDMQLMKNGINRIF